MILIAACAGVTGVAAQNNAQKLAKTADLSWPTRPVRILVGFPPGSTPDMAARTLAEPLSRALGQPVIVENKPGAAGNIAADQVAKSTDDHTLGIVINGNLTSAALLYKSLPYKPDTDFALISQITAAPLVLVVPANSPVGADFFVAAKQGGGTWNYGSPGAGSVAHLGLELLKSRVPGLQPAHIPYPGNPQVITALLAGQIQMALVPPGLAMPQVRAGKLKAIGLAGGRSPLVGDVPSLAELGIKDFNLEVWNALVGPAALSKAAQTRLATEVPRIVRDADTRQKLFAQGWQAVGTSPEGLGIRVREEAAILGGIIRAQNIRID